METLLRLVSAINPSNVADSIDSLPDAWLTDLRSEDWITFRIVTGGTFVNVSAEKFEAMEREQIADYRTGVETLRAYFDGDDSR